MSKGVEITTRDRVLRAWENSMELVRDYQNYAEEIKESDIKSVFRQYAEDECYHASKFHSMLLEMDNKK